MALQQLLVSPRLMGDASRTANLAAVGNWTKDGPYRDALL